MLENPITLENFKFDTDCAVIEETGCWQHNMFGKLCYDINYSNILTKLIQLAGINCKHYASDLFISWESLLKEMEEKGVDFAGGKYLFGFRESGVDHNSYVLNTFNPYGYITSNPQKHYKELYLLEIKVEKAEEMVMRLCKAQFVENPEK